MHVSAQSYYDAAAIAALHHITRLHGRSLFRRLMIWGIPLSVVFFLGLLTALLTRSYTALTVPVALIGVLALVVLYLYVFFPKIQCHVVSEKANTRDAFLFEEDCFHVTSRGTGGEKTATYDYDMLDRAYETDAYLFFYISLKPYIIVEKAGMEEGDVEAIRTRLQIYLDKKYVQVNGDGEAAGYSR